MFTVARDRSSPARCDGRSNKSSRGSHSPTNDRPSANFLGSWLLLKRMQLRARTFASYEHAVSQIEQASFARLPLAKLTPQQLSAWFHSEQAAGASARTIRYRRAVLRAALNQALRWSLVTRNAASLTDAPRHQSREIQPLTPAQARTLLDTAKDHRLGAVGSVATALGLRMGESLGLRWQDIDFDLGTLSVRQALERSGGNRAARRTLDSRTAVAPAAAHSRAAP